MNVLKVSTGGDCFTAYRTNEVDKKITTMQAEIDGLVFYIKAQHAVLQEQGWTSYQQDKKVEGLVRKLKQEKE